MKAKKIMTIAISAFLLLSSNTIIRAGNTEDGVNKKAKNYINASIEYPVNDDNISGFVIVEYKVDTAGNIDINAINASHSKLKEHVLSSVENLTIHPKAAVKDTSFICKYVFVSKEEYNEPKKSNGMKTVIGVNEITAEK